MKDRYVRGIHSYEYAKHWKDGMVSGNGLLGVVSYGKPGNEAFLYQNTTFNLPNDGVREAPDISGVLAKVRELTLAGKGNEALKESEQAATAWIKQYKQDLAAEWDIVNTYSFHPGYEARISIHDESKQVEHEDGGQAIDEVDAQSVSRPDHYYRWTNYETAETGSSWVNSSGAWCQRTFVSRVDHVIITQLERMEQGENDGAAATFSAKVSIDLEHLDGFHQTGINSHKVIDLQESYMALLGKYPSYEHSPLKTGGYGGVTRIITDGRIVEGSEGFAIKDATTLTLLTVLDRQPKDFTLEEPAFVEYLNHKLDAVIARYLHSHTGKFNYEHALQAHAEVHGKMMKRVELGLCVDEQDRQLSSEELLARQRLNKEELLPALVEKVFDAGRYAYICASGYNPPRLMGIWTGEYKPQWSGDFTTDANINLQIAGGNIGNTPEAMEGYIDLIFRNIEDWELNAERIFGIKDALLAPPRTDGDGDPLTHFSRADVGNPFPGHYWISGASWLLLPIYEYYLAFGNRAVPNGKGKMEPVLELLYKYLVKLGNFYRGYLSEEYVDEQGAYILLPTYSPENVPANRDSTVQPNATMDIAAAKDALQMLIHVAAEKKVAEGEIQKWKEKIDRLPDYQYSADGTLKEWAMEDIEDQHFHRHISHLYPAWPALETHKTNDRLLIGGIMKVMDNRQQVKGQDAAHGLIHRGLVEARVHRAEGVYASILPLFTEDYMYSSLMMSHNSHHKSLYCTDGIITIPAIIMEALVYSDKGSIQLLPALPKQWSKGTVRGLRTRNQATIEELAWDMMAGEVNVTIVSDVEQELNISCYEAINMQTSSATTRLYPNKAITVSFRL